MPKPFVPADQVRILESPEAVLSTWTREGKRRWIYPTPSQGRFYQPRLILGWVLIVLFIALPILKMNDKPVVLLDFIHREFALFGFVFFPTDTFLLLPLMMGTVFSIFFFSALLGRVWCGWACPQTVYLEFVYRPLERLIEGKEHVRKRRDDGPWSWDKAWRKGLKHTLFLIISIGLAHVFLSYFVGWKNLLLWVQSSPTEHWGFFVMMAITTGLVLFNFGYFREQMCTIICPYARLQSVLLDEDSMIVSYDPNRGEPRAKRGKKILAQEAEGTIAAKGDCIDCMACVRTCPTGIDIRDGLQMECIACTQCIDACDDIMHSIDKPIGLIRYTSERELKGQRTRLVRPRTLIYSLLFVSLSVLFTIVLTTRDAFDIYVGRSPGEPFMVLPDGRIANRLQFRVRNQMPEATAFAIEVAEPADLEVRIVGVSPVSLAPQEMKRVEAWIVAPAPQFVTNTLPAVLRLRFDNGTVEDLPYTLLGPSP